MIAGMRSRAATGGTPLPLQSKGSAHLGSAGFPPRGFGAQGSSSRPLSLGGNSLVVAILSPFLALTSASAQSVLVSIVILDISLQFGTHLFYREDDASVEVLGGLSFAATALALRYLYLPWLIRVFANRDQAPRASGNV